MPRILILLLGSLLVAQHSRAQDQSFEDFLFYFDQGVLQLPEPLAAQYLQVPAGSPVLTHQHLAYTHGHDVSYLHQGQLHVATFSATKQPVETFALPISDQQPHITPYADSLLEITHTELGTTHHTYLHLTPTGLIFPLSAKPVRMAEPEEILFRRLLQFHDLAEHDSATLQHWSHLIYAARGYKFTDPALRQQMHQALPAYLPRTRRKHKVPLTDLERLNLFILHHYLSTGQYPK